MVLQGMEDKKVLKIYEEFMPNVYRYAYSKLGNKAEAEDATSETFLAFIQKYKQVQDPHAWLIGTCRNIIYKKFRDKPQIQEVELLENDIADEQPVENEAVDEQLLAEIKADLLKLDEITREIITLKIWEDLKFGEVATILNVSENTVKAKYYRGLKQLSDKQTKMRAIAIPLLLLAFPRLASAAEYQPSASFGDSLRSQISNNFNLANLTMMQKIYAKISALPMAAKLVIAVLLVSCVVGLLLLFIYLNQPLTQNSGGQNSSSSMSSTTSSEEPLPIQKVVFRVYKYPQSEIWMMDADGNNKELLVSSSEQNMYYSNLVWRNEGELTYFSCTYASNTDDKCDLTSFNTQTKTKQVLRTISGGVRAFAWAPNKQDYAYSVSTSKSVQVPNSEFMDTGIHYHLVKGGQDQKLVTAGWLFGTDARFDVPTEILFSEDGSQVAFSDYMADLAQVNGTTLAGTPVYLYEVTSAVGKWVYDAANTTGQRIGIEAFQEDGLVYVNYGMQYGPSDDKLFKYSTAGQVTALGDHNDIALRAQVNDVNKFLLSTRHEYVQGVGITFTLNEFDAATAAIRKVGDNLINARYLNDGSIIASQTTPNDLNAPGASFYSETAIVRVSETGEVTTLYTVPADYYLSQFIFQ